MIIFNTKKLYGGQRLGVIEGGALSDNHPARQVGLEDESIYGISVEDLDDDEVVMDPPGKNLFRIEDIQTHVENQHSDSKRVGHEDDRMRIRWPMGHEMSREDFDRFKGNIADSDEEDDEDSDEEDDDGYDVNRTPDSDEEDDYSDISEEEWARMRDAYWSRFEQIDRDIRDFLTQNGINRSDPELYEDARNSVRPNLYSGIDEREDNWRNDIQRFLSERNPLTFAPPGGAPPPSPPQGSTAASRRRPREDDGEGPDTSRPRLGRGPTGGKLKIKKPKHLKSIVHTIAHDIAKPIGEDLGKGFGPVNPFSLGYDLGYKVIGPAILKSTGGGGRGGKFRG